MFIQPAFTDPKSVGITSFWAKGYRSLKDVRLEGLGAFNVFYGPNGSGKSNVLAAIQTYFDLLGRALTTSSVPFLQSDGRPVLAHTDASVVAGTAVLALLNTDDFYAQERTTEIVLGAVLVLLPRDPR